MQLQFENKIYLLKIAEEINLLNKEVVKLQKRVRTPNGQEVAHVSLEAKERNEKYISNIYVPEFDKYLTFYNKKRNIMVINDDINVLSYVLAQLKEQYRVYVESNKSWLERREEAIRIGTTFHLTKEVAIKAALDIDSPFIVNDGSRNKSYHCGTDPCVEGVTGTISYAGSSGNDQFKELYMNAFRPRTMDIYIKDYPKEKPIKIGKYLVYRASDQKLCFAAWNGTQWGYDDNVITNWIDITDLKSKLKTINNEKD